MKKIKDILKLRFITDISYRQISRAVDVPSSTVADYCCKRFEITRYTIDEFLKIDEDTIYQLLFAEKKLPNKYKNRPLPDVEYSHKEIAKKGVTFELLWMEYKEKHPNGIRSNEARNLKVEDIGFRKIGRNEYMQIFVQGKGSSDGFVFIDYRLIEKEYEIEQQFREGL